MLKYEKPKMFSVLKFHSQIPVIPSWPTYFDELTSLPPRVAKLKDIPASHLLILLNHLEQRILTKGHVVSEKKGAKRVDFFTD